MLHRIISRPIATCLVALSVLIAGGAGFARMMVTPIPSVADPVVEVLTEYPGASSDVVEKTVTAPLRNQLARIPGLQADESFSTEGQSRVVLTFDSSVSLDVATQDIQSAINDANRFLPDDLSYPPIYRKFNPSDAPVVRIAVSSSKRRIDSMASTLDLELTTRLSQIPGVGNVVMGGGRRGALRIVFDMAKLESAGLTPEDIRAAIVNANVLAPKGVIENGETSLTVETNDALREAEAYREIVVQTHDGAVLRLGALANVTDGAEDSSAGQWYNGKRVLLIDVYRQPNANILTIARRVKAALPVAVTRLPEGVELNVVGDRSLNVRQATQATRFELALAVGAVAFVMFAFFRSVRTSMIPILTIPVVLAGTTAMLFVVGATLNPLTMIALAIGSSFAVDDALVVLEHIGLWLARSELTRHEAVVGATRNIAFSIVSLSACILAILVPVFFLPGVVGRIFHDIVIALAGTVTFSALASLSLTPALAALFFERPTDRASSGSARPIRFRSTNHHLERLHYQIVNRPAIGVAAVLVASVCAAALLFGTGKALLPEQGGHVLHGQIVAPAGLSFIKLSSLAEQVQRALRDAPNVNAITVDMSRASSTGLLNVFDVDISLKHEDSPTELIAQEDKLHAFLKSTMGLGLYVGPEPAIPLDIKPAGNSYRVMIEAESAESLRTTLPKVVTAMRESDEFSSVWSPDAQNMPAFHLAIDRETAARYGVSMRAIDDTLYDSNVQRIVSTVYRDASQQHVVISSFPASIAETLNQAVVRASGNSVMPLSAFTSVSTVSMPSRIHHSGAAQVADIYFDVTSGSSLPRALAALRTIVADAGQQWGGVRVDIRGDTELFETSERDGLHLLLVSCLCVYFVLGILFESLIYPLCVIASLPVSLCGALLALEVAGQSLDVVSFLGALLVMGIVLKNGILVMDGALKATKVGMPPTRAILVAIESRIRPIFMTTLASAIAAVPIAFSFGAGAEMRRPMALAVIGGLALSQVISLYSTGALFVLARRWSTSAKRLQRTRNSFGNR